MTTRRRSRSCFRRRLLLESLENRYTLNADIDGNGVVVPLDALLVANAIAAAGDFAANPRFDINGDSEVDSRDFDAVIASLDDDVGDGSAGSGPIANYDLAEGKGSESRGGEGIPEVSMSVSGTSVKEEGETTKTITLYRTEPVTSALTVGLYSEGWGSHVADANDYQLLRDSTPVGSSVTFGIGESSVALTFKAIDDTTEEYDEQRMIGISDSTQSPPTYTTHAYAYHQAMTIEDDEWRWVFATTADYEFEWAPVPTAIVRPGFDGALYPHGTAMVGLNSYSIQSWAKAVYVYEYEASMPEERLEFSCNGQTGAIAVTTTPTTLVANPSTWVSAGLGYSYSIRESSSEVHTVAVSSTFMAGAGGTFGATPSSGTTSGASNTAWTTVETWAVQAPNGAHSATLRCMKGPDPNE